MSVLAVVWVAALSLGAFVACVVDKVRARGGAARVPERVLLVLALVGGTPGLVLGMVVARHKTRKASFLAALLAVVVVQAGAVGWYLRSA